MVQNVRGPYRFSELSRTQIGDNVWLVVSTRSDRKIVVALANIVVAEGRSKTVFMTDPPLVLRDMDALGNAGNCLLDAFEKLQKRNAFDNSEQAISAK